MVTNQTISNFTKRVAALVAATILSTFTMQAFAQSELPVTTLPQFTSLKVEADMNLTLIEVADGEQLRLEYDLGDNDPAKFKADVRRGELKISQPYNARSVSKIEATLYYNSALTKLSFDRAVVKFATTFKAPIAEISIDDSAFLEGAVDCADLELTAESNSRLGLTGDCEYVLLKAKSGAKVELRKMECRSVEVEVSHGAVVALTAGDRMKVSTSTSGVVKYWGEPTILRKTSKLISGSLQQQK